MTHHTPTSSPLHLHGLLLCLVCTMCMLTSSLAYASDPVIVLPHGGLRELPSLELIEAQVDTWQVVARAPLRILPDEQPLDVFSEIKMLPNQTALISGFSQQARDQIAIVDPSTQTLEVAWQADNTFSQVASASVATSLTPGDPSRLLITDSNASLVQIWDREQGAFVWRQSVYIQGARAVFVQAIMLPENRVITASNWAAVSVGGVDIFNLTPGPEEPATYRIASQSYQGAPPELLIQPALRDVRDIMAIDANTLLVTSASSLFTMNLKGTILWMIDRTSLPQLNGEFASARVMPSGRIVLATFEPGKWTQPHPNHRIHWFAAPASPDVAPTLLATSSPLERAPQRVASAESTGGTGTLGYEGGVNSMGGDGEVDALALGSAIMVTQEQLSPGDFLEASVVFSNPTSMTISPKKMVIRGVPGRNCTSGFLMNFVLIESELSPRIAPLGIYTLRGKWPITETTSRGAWCLFPSIQREDDSWRNFTGSTASMTVLGDVEGTTVPREELPFERFEVGAGEDMGDVDMHTAPPIIFTPVEDEDPGCGCQQSAPIPGAPLELLGVCAGLWGWRRRQRPRAR